VSDGSAVYLTTTLVSTTHGTSTVVVNLASDGEGILLTKDHPVSPGDIAVLSGTSGADGTYHVATIPTDTSFTTVEIIPSSTGGNVTFMYPSGLSYIGFNTEEQTVTSSTVAQQALTDISNHELLDNEPVSLGTTYSVTRVNRRVTQEKWSQTSNSNVIKTINYTYTGNKVTQEVRTVYDTATGLTVVAQATITYTYSGNSVTSENIVRNV
jgi:hypothetical protein